MKGERKNGEERGGTGIWNYESVMATIPSDHKCGIMCYYVMSCNYFLSVTIYVLYNYVQFSWSSVAHRVVSPS